MNGNGLGRVQFGPFEVDLHTHELWKFGTRVKLVGQPFDVLAILLTSPGELVTREELRDRLWPGDTYVDFNHGLNAAVNRLREALSDSADTPRYIETLPRRGYRFIATVERLDASHAGPPAAASQAAVVSAEALPVPQERTIHPAASRPPRWRQYAVIAGVFAALLLVSVILGKKLQSSDVPSQSAAPQIKPLTTLADETNQPAFSPDGNYVAFHRDSARPEDSGIYVKAIGSGQLVQLTKNRSDGFPVWSPDGRSIAFSRPVNGRNDDNFEIFVVPSARGAETKLDTNGVIPKRGELDWSPDGKTIAFNGGAGIFLLSLENSTVHRLTEPPHLSEDWGPAFSPDGARMLFVRGHGAGFPEDILVIPTAGGDATHVTTEAAEILGPPRWSADGRSVIFASYRGGQPALWRASVDVRDTPVEINDGGWFPAISRRGHRLAYQRQVRGMHIWQMDLSASDKKPVILVPSSSQSDQGPAPQFSPDGKKLAYMSDRSGTMEIWVSDRDGSNPYQLTDIGDAGTPRWSPDSQSIAFDARGGSERVVYVIGLRGGPPRLVGDDRGDDQTNRMCPSWSRDGKWIYFTSSRTGQFQVWKAPASGGAPVQLTFHGGHAPLASPDGKYIFYAKTLYANPEIWQVPVDGGVEKLLSPLVRPATWASWAVVDRGIVFAASSGKGQPAVSFFDLAKHKVTTLGVLRAVPFWLGATRDGNTVAFDQPGWQQDQVMLVENFQ